MQRCQALSGKMATVDIEAITDKGQTFGRGECVVNVVPYLSPHL